MTKKEFKQKFLEFLLNPKEMVPRRYFNILYDIGSKIVNDKVVEEFDWTASCSDEFFSAITEIGNFNYEYPPYSIYYILLKDI